jgi:hypothetical protein
MCESVAGILIWQRDFVTTLDVPRTVQAVDLNLDPCRFLGLVLVIRHLEVAGYVCPTRRSERDRSGQHAVGTTTQFCLTEQESVPTVPRNLYLPGIGI